MITVRYERYWNDYRKYDERQTFYSLEGVADWFFGMCRGSYKDGMYFTNPDKTYPYHKRDCDKLDSSSISIHSIATSDGYSYHIDQIEIDGVIVYSDGKFTNGIRHWNETIKQWLRDCRARQSNPQFNFG